MPFAGCLALEKVVIEEGCEQIIDSAFSGCTSLTSITIPSTVYRIDAGALDDDTKLTEININNNKNFIMKDGIIKTADETKIIFITDEILKKSSTFEIPAKVTEFSTGIGKYENITTLKIPASLTHLGVASIFPKTIENVIIDENNTKYAVGDNIIYDKNNKALIMCFSKEKDIIIQEGILTLNSHCFKQAENAENIILPESLKTITNATFQEGSNYKKIYIGKNVSNINSCFKVVNYKGTVEIDSENPYYMVENNIVYSKDKQTLLCALYRITGTFTVDSAVKNIAGFAFDAQGMEEVIIPEGVTTIGSGAFSQCGNLKKIEIPSTVIEIGYSTFERCNSLENIVINRKSGSISENPWGAPKGDRAIKWLK